MPRFNLGESIPPDTAHAVSVSLPTWKSNIGYEKGEDWVVKTMACGYPRFFIHKSIEAFAIELAAHFGGHGARAILFPTRRTALRCVEFIRRYAPEDALSRLDVVHLVLDTTKPSSGPLRRLGCAISAVIIAPEAFPFAKQYWQHSGDGVSSRRAEFCHGLWTGGLLVRATDDNTPTSPLRKGPRRYQRPMSTDGGYPPPSPRADANGHNGHNGHNGNGHNGHNGHVESKDATSEQDANETSRFVEERFGRNLDISFLEPARSAIRRRIAGALRHDFDLTAVPLPEMGSSSRGVADLREEDIYLYPCGMNAIFNAHRMLLAARGAMKSINYGFSYVDTLKILQKFGPGCLFYGHASSADLDDLEARLRGGERFLALFCEFPGNPLLTCPDLGRIRRLADEYDFAVVVDETIGTFANVNVLPFADIVASSLTKIFSGDCNVMGGSAIINPRSRYYGALKAAAAREHEDTYWAEDVIFMERNSRDFASRVDRINANAEAICAVLTAHPLVAAVYYPKHNPSRPNYEACRVPGGGYGGLLSVVFRDPACAVAFYDAIDTAKGPSLGTNFTLTSPYVLLAHFLELDWAASMGVDRDLIRISVGLEETDEIVAVFRAALAVAEKVAPEQQS